MTAYIALLRKDSASDYGVDFPDFPGCITAGRSLEEARRMAVEALRLHIEGIREDGGAIPPASALDGVMADAQNHEAVAFLVDVPERPGRAVRINVMLPEDILQAIDRAATNRSRFLADAAREKLGRGGAPARAGAAGSDSRKRRAAGTA
ncbi:MAG: type II toxin-antitoxin system HicB family antitoxin [Acidisphaera sp.]|nr:type II toxin-antitoxin system HicB family antitoxin [Acidisphaera sp.]